MRTRWKCRSCGSDFAKPEPWYTGSSIGHAPDAVLCPYCKSDDIGEADTCANCGGAFFGDELMHGFCEGCVEDMLDDYAAEYVTSDEDLFEGFAYYMHKRTSGEAST